MIITKLECSYASKYKAAREPHCGCATCALKWHAKQIAVLTAAVTNLEHNRGRDEHPERFD